MQDEKIVVVPNLVVKNLLNNHMLFNSVALRESFLAMLNSLYDTEMRSVVDAEDYTGDLIQVIPYCHLFVPYDNKSVYKDDMIFTAQRNNKQTEKRLHNFSTIGFGGHINIDDCDKNLSLNEIIFKNIIREVFNEELDINAVQYDVKYLGIIYDKSVPVSVKHLGIVIRVIPKIVSKFLREHLELLVELKEDTHCNAKWVTVSGLRLDNTEYENWSRIVIDNFF